ncbi:FtsX-like permease family protein [Sphingomonas sp. PR090111-T3T-6A]|uniref:FtsX-like permease family protein n=1 Tax=Sphingomonas sp. PR090111-T3T-6A TaxID=685778 RepID=UPI0003723FF0|nr:FtsX-like permease family protein [Sphingomonas sp. PR090111-T3T-6A]
MNRFAFVTFYRSLVRHKLYAALNIGGLAVGIAVFIVLGLYVRFETSYEHWLPHHDQIYLVQDNWNLPGQFEGPIPTSMGGWLETFQRDFPDIEGTRIDRENGTVLRNGTGTSEGMQLVDPKFLDIFRLTIVRGNAAGALADPANLLISQTVAGKYFPGADPIGQPMTIVLNGTPRLYRVAAVFEDLPRNTELQANIIARLVPKQVAGDYWYHWGSESLYTYLRFPTPEAARALGGKLDDFVLRHAKQDMGKRPLDIFRETLLPISDLHLQAKGARLTVTTLGIVGALTLLIAVINYVNLATARASLRAREVAMRKVLGADRKTLMRHFIGEAMATAALAAFVGLAIAEIGLPLVNAAGNLSLSIHYIGQDGVLLPLVLLVILVGLAAGLYPAVLLSRFPAAGVLAASRSAGGGRAGTRVREALVVLQFALATAFIVGTMVLTVQTRHVRNADLGFARNGLIVVPSLTEERLTEGQRVSIVNSFAALPGVRAVSRSDTAPGDERYQNHNNLKLPGMLGNGPSLMSIVGDRGFFRVFEPKLLAGRLPDDAHREDDSAGRPPEQSRNIVLNRRAAAQLGLTPQQAVGKTLTGDATRTVIGVVDDMRFYSPRDGTRAAYYTYKSRDIVFPIATVRFDGDPRGMTEALRNAWRSVAPEVPFKAVTADQNLETYYKSDDQAARLFAIGAGLAVAIGCVGLWGLASFNTQRRVREIGIRKTLGASSRDVVLLLVTQFLRPVVIGNLIAWPLAFIAMRTWLAGFEDRIGLSPLYFLGATLASLLIAVATVLMQSLRAARAAPAWALRHE